jgi:hypothetical protein
MTRCHSWSLSSTTGATVWPTPALLTTMSSLPRFPQRAEGLIHGAAVGDVKTVASTASPPRDNSAATIWAFSSAGRQSRRLRRTELAGRRWPGPNPGRLRLRAPPVSQAGESSLGIIHRPPHGSASAAIIPCPSLADRFGRMTGPAGFNLRTMALALLHASVPHGDLCRRSQGTLSFFHGWNFRLVNVGQRSAGRLNTVDTVCNLRAFTFC